MEDEPPESPLAHATQEASRQMLTITPQALTVIQRVTGHPMLEPTSGLRIACPEEPDAPLRVRAVRGPRPGDNVLERLGGRLYLEPDTVQRLEDGELDAVTNEDGRVQFVLRAAS